MHYTFVVVQHLGFKKQITKRQQLEQQQQQHKRTYSVNTRAMLRPLPFNESGSILLVVDSLNLNLYDALKFTIAL